MDNIPTPEKNADRNPRSRNLAYRYAITCNYKKHDKLIDYLKETLKANDFKCLTVENGDTDIILLSYNNEQKLLQEAQSCKLRKTFLKETQESIDYDIKLDSRIIEQEKRKNFINEFKNQYVGDSYYDINYSNVFKNTKKNEELREKQEDWGFGLFTEAEMLYLETKLLNEVKIDKEIFINLAKENEKLAKKADDIEKILSYDDQIISVYSYFKIIQDQTPIHISNFKNEIMKETLFSLRSPYRKIRSYFGDKVAMYYAWFYHYTRWLTIPAMATLFILILNFILPNYSKVYLTVYALLLSIWSQIFLIYFQRKCSEISVEWDNITEEYDKDNFRRQFKGEWRRSPITGKYEKYYPNSKRIPKFLLSIVCAIPMIILSVSANITNLNLSGFIQPNSLFEINFLVSLNQPGQIFDKSSIQYKFIGIFFGLLMGKINGLYQAIARKTTDWENHKVQSSYDNSLILKRFIFEFFNYFLSPFYLAFVVFNMEGLRQSMSTLYISNQISRLIDELVVPFVISLIKRKINIRGNFSTGNYLENIRGQKISKEEIIRQVSSDPYNDYSDYLSIVLEFGNLVLFAEYFPLAPVYLLFFNNIEMRIDIISLCNFYRRPMPIRKRNIGSWKIILNIISCFGIFTNLFFSMFIKEDNISLNILKLNADDEKLNKDANTLYYFFLLEHLVVILIALINYTFETVSPWVKLYLERRDYKAKENKWKALIERFKIAKEINKPDPDQKTANDVEAIKKLIHSKLEK